MHVDLRDHLVVHRASAGHGSASASRIILQPGEAVSLHGPLGIRVRLFGHNTMQAPGQTVSTETSPLFSYELKIPSGHTWAYAVPVETPLLAALGVNTGLVVIIDPLLGGAEQRPELGTSAELSCDLATKDRPDASRFFPVGCEPCAPGLRPTLPPLEAPVDIPVAPGGCVRPRYFDGMFLTREDLEAEQRYHLIKHRMQNRAAGAGVVWGLDVGLQDRSVCVKPGLAWDCCGHDLVVTAPYRVEIASLVRDPAAAARLALPGPHRMHLLLEYVECPDDPRPVHGDPCSPEVSRCEMARTRETVRLRLVPPRDFDGTGPIDRFLEETDGVDWDPDEAEPPVDELLPFTVQISRGGSTMTLQPRTLTEQVADLAQTGPGPIDLVAGLPLGSSFEQSSRVRLLPPGPSTILATVGPEGRLSWSANMTMGANGIVMMEIDWVAGDRRGKTQLVARDFTGAGNIEQLTVYPTLVEQLPGPCDHEACAAAEGSAAAEGNATPRFPADPPYLHPHPDRPDRAADPAVLGLAWDYAWSWVRGNGPSPTDPDPIHPTVAATLRDLLETWSESLLYRGPSCSGAPHGVVIGCALVEGGELLGVEPWGGRRWSLQYGLIAHWATQLGILPPDLLMSKLAALAGCVGGLPPPVPPTPPDQTGTPRPVPPRGDAPPSRVRALAEAALAGQDTPPLLRGATGELATRLAEGLPLAGFVEGRPAWLGRLAAEGVWSVGALLAASPEALHEGVLRGEHAAELGALLGRAEEAVTATARGVAGAIGAAAAEHKLASRAALAGARAALEPLITKRLADARVPGGAAAVRRAVEAALGASSRGGRA